MEQLIPILFSEPKSNTPPVLPFKFIGGLALPTKTLGLILSLQGVLQMIVQLIVFPIISRKFGSLLLFRATIAAYPILYFLIPYVILLPDGLRMIGVFAILLVKVSAQSFSYPSLTIMLTNWAPSKKVLGTLNGSAASSASLCRTFGPTVAGFIHAQGRNLGYSGLAWWTISLIAGLGFMESLFMRAAPPKEGRNEADEESVIVEQLIDPSGLAIMPEETTQARQSSERRVSYGSLDLPLKGR